MTKRTRPPLVAEVRRLTQELAYADRAMRERHTRFATLHADVSLLARELGMLGDGEYAPDEHEALCDFMRRVQNEVENLRLAQTLGSRVAEVDVVAERKTWLDLPDTDGLWWMWAGEGHDPEPVRVHTERKNARDPRRECLTIERLGYEDTTHLDDVCERYGVISLRWRKMEAS